MTQRGALYAGTSGWTYDDWTSAFYPKGVRGARRLSYYATQFNTVEVNATFYRYPSAAMIAAWNRTLPEEFHLVLKGSRRITHFNRLRDVEELVALFLERARQLATLRALLWQLHPQTEKDLSLLREFLALLPSDIRHAIEFRHDSWWSDDVADMLEESNVAFVGVSHPTLPKTVYRTANFTYLRFHGIGEDLYDYDYSDTQLREWVE